MKMLLIDGNSVLFRGFYATYRNMMQTTDGIYTNAVFAFAHMLNRALSLIHPEYCVVAFDKGKHTFRHELAADYKGTRKPAPAELGSQFALAREYLKAYNIPFLEYDDYEADDIIGSLAKKYKQVETAILTSDRDLLQLIDSTTTVYLMKKGLSEVKAMNETTLYEDFALYPKQIIDLKALMGDASDNIKGVSGIGEKTALKLLHDYGDITNLYANLDKIKGRQQKMLTAGREDCLLSYQLATIKTDIAINQPLSDFILKLDKDAVNDFYAKYEMYSLQQLALPNNDSLTVKRVEKVNAELLKEDVFIYVDSDYFQYYQPKIYGLVFASDTLLEYIPFENFLTDSRAQAFIASAVHKITYDYKFLLHAFKAYNLAKPTAFDDLLLMGFIKNNHYLDLKTLFTAYGQPLPQELALIYGTVKKPKVVDTVEQTNNAALIAKEALAIYHELLRSLKEDDEYALYCEIELPLCEVLYAMEEQGIVCDEQVIARIGEETLAKLEDIGKRIYLLAGHEFNINSPKQLADVLFTELGLPANRKRSTSAGELAKIEIYHPLVGEILQYRKYAKLYSSYVEGLKRYIGRDSRIHTVFSQTIAQTGRLSSYDPNLQNIAVRDEEGRNIRKAFLASKDHILISSDYSQIELRVLAALADEEKMIDAFNAGIDIHRKTAMEIFKLPEEAIDDHLRRKAKAVNFGVVYGISDFGLAQQARIGIKEARQFIEEYFHTFPKIKQFMDETIAFCQEYGYVKTMMNRRRYIDEINSNDFAKREFGKRAAMNSRVQGSAADLIKKAMVDIQRAIEQRHLKAKLVLQIHDELIFDVPLEEKEEMIALIAEGMKNAYHFKVKLDCVISTATNWYEAK